MNLGRGHYMRKILSQLTHLLQDEAGVTAIEYALIAALIAVVIIASVTSVGQAVLELFNDVSTKLEAAIN